MIHRSAQIQFPGHFVVSLGWSPFHIGRSSRWRPWQHLWADLGRGLVYQQPLKSRFRFGWMDHFMSFSNVATLAVDGGDLWKWEYFIILPSHGVAHRRRNAVMECWDLLRTNGPSLQVLCLFLGCDWGAACHGIPYRYTYHSHSFPTIQT